MKSLFKVFAFGILLMAFSCTKDAAVDLSSTAKVYQVETSANDYLRKNNGEQGTIMVQWKDGSPVHGARVFDERNRLIGETNKNGTVTLEFGEPTVLRVVDPAYGRYQEEILYPDDFREDVKGGGKRKVVGWDMDGNPVYDDE